MYYVFTANKHVLALNWDLFISISSKSLVPKQEKERHYFKTTNSQNIITVRDSLNQPATDQAAPLETLALNTGLEGCVMGT